MTDKQLLFLIIGLLCCSIILLISVTVKLYISQFVNNKFKSNFANYNDLSQDKSLELIANNANRRDILDLPIKDFYFNTSHNSYLSGTQILTNGNSPNSTIQALKGGARMIEFDVYQGSNDNIPIVAHKNGDTAYTNIVNFDTHIKAVRDYAFKNTNDPLIIGLELYAYSNENHMRAVSDIIQQYLGDRLYMPSLAYAPAGTEDNNSWKNIRMRDALGKIFILIPGMGRLNTPSRTNYNNYLRKVSHGWLDQNDPYKEPSTSKTIWNTITLQTTPGNITYNLNSSAHNTKSENSFSRIYPFNILWSDNTPPGEMWAYNHNAVAENFSNSNVSDLGNIYLNKFRYSNVVPLNSIIQDQNNIYSPYLITIKNYSGLLYQGVRMDIPYLKSGTIYRNESSWKSDNNNYELRMQGDGNLVIYGPRTWQSKTFTDKKNPNQGSYLFMQPDGNLVIYRASNLQAIWSSGTSGNPGAVAYLHNDGALRIRHKGKTLNTFNAP